MSLRLRFNLVLTVVFLLGLAVSGVVSRGLLLKSAEDEVIRDAELMIEAALAVRGNTVEQIRPHLVDKLDELFLPETVHAYAAASRQADRQRFLATVAG